LRRRLQARAGRIRGFISSTSSVVASSSATHTKQPGRVTAGVPPGPRGSFNPPTWPGSGPYARISACVRRTRGGLRSARPGRLHSASRRPISLRSRTARRACTERSDRGKQETQPPTVPSRDGDGNRVEQRSPQIAAGRQVERGQQEEPCRGDCAQGTPVGNTVHEPAPNSTRRRPAVAAFR
jgi:hypothetical protein